MLDRSQWIAIGLVSGFAYILGKDRESFEAPYSGSGSLMGIKQDTSIGDFSTKELTESSAIHGDFNEASLNYSGHQNIQVRGSESFEAQEPLEMIHTNDDGDVLEIKLVSPKRGELRWTPEENEFCEFIISYEGRRRECLVASDSLYNNLVGKSLVCDRKNHTISGRTKESGFPVTVTFGNIPKFNRICSMIEDKFNAESFGAEIMGSVGDIENHSVDKYKTKHFLTDKELSDFLIKHGTNHDSIRKNKKAKGNIIISTPEGGWISEAKFSLSQPDNENDKDILMIIPDDYLGIHQDAESFEAEKKNCGCGQDPCVTYGAEPCESESFEADNTKFELLGSKYIEGVGIVTEGSPYLKNYYGEMDEYNIYDDDAAEIIMSIPINDSRLPLKDGEIELIRAMVYGYEHPRINDSWGELNEDGMFWTTKVMETLANYEPSEAESSQ